MRRSVTGPPGGSGSRGADGQLGCLRVVVDDLVGLQGLGLAHEEQELGERLYRIADLSRVWVLADVYEYEVPWIAKGQTARVTLSYLPGKTFEGRVDYIFPYLESKTRTVRVRDTSRLRCFL